MNVQEQLANLARSIDSEQAPVTVEEIRHGDRTVIADVDRAESTARRSRRGWMAAAAAIVLLLVGVGALVIWSGDEPSRIEPADTDPQQTPTTLPEAPITVAETPATTATSAPEPTTSTPDAQAGWTGGLLGDIDETSLRPLDSFSAGDVIVPTAPSSWRVFTSSSASPDDSSTVRSSLSIMEAQPVTHPTGGQVIDEAGQRIDLTLTEAPDCPDSRGCSPSSPPATINGIEWQSFAAEDQPNTIPYSGARASVGDLWVWVTAPEIVSISSGDGTNEAIGGFDDLLAEPTVIEYLEGLRIGSPDDLAAVGTACWNCGAAVVDFGDNAQLVRNSEIDRNGLRPLATLQAGDVLIPTAPANWYQVTPLRADTDDDEIPVSLSTVFLDTSVNRRVEMYVAPTCDANADTCDIGDTGRGILWPIVDQFEAGGVTWGYPGGMPEEGLATVIGDYVISILWDPPTSNEDDAMAFLEGLRVTSLAELPEQIDVVDEFGRPIDRASGQLPPTPAKQAVATAEVRGVTLAVNAQQVGDEVCLSLDRADTGETVRTAWPSGCAVTIDPAAEGNVVIEVAQLLAGPDFNTLTDGQEPEYLLVGYVDAPNAVDVRASYQGSSVDGRSADPVDGFDGVFVAMSVTALDDTVNFFADGYNPNVIELEIIDAAG